MILSDLHTHTTFCDGKNTPVEMIERAIAKGFVSFGLSGHAPLSYEPSWTMSEEKEEAYIAEVGRLKEVYSGKIDLLLGCECDFYSTVDRSRYDYVIGSVHCIFCGEHYLSVDESEETFTRNVQTCYGGDYYAYVKDYFATEKQVVEKLNCDIIGHFDIVGKFNPSGKYYDETDPRYRAAVSDAVETLAKQGRPFEINTAVTFRHDRENGSPSARYWLSVLYECGGNIVINSDAHLVDRIGDHFEQACTLAKKQGFRHALILRTNGFEEITL